MKSLTRVAVVAMAMALLGSACATNAISTPTSTSSPVPTAAPNSPSTSPTQIAAPLSSGGTLDAGTYSIPAGPMTPLTVTLPSGWTTDEGFVYKNRASSGEVLVVAWIVSHVYTDACHWQGSLTAVGTTVDQLASALQAQKGRVASAPTDVRVDGFPAKRIELTVPASLDVASCDHGILRFWPDPGPDESGGLCCTAAGSTDVVYVVDVAGHRVAIVARHQSGSSTQDLAELQQVVASINLDPPASSPSSPSPIPTQ